ncbi:TIR domain-containing protein [Streptomyces goshikiensis]
MSRIFINYRRAGGAYAAALLDELLSRQFGADQIFRAARSLHPGADYSDEIFSAAMNCAAMLVLIDEGWADCFESDDSDSSTSDSWAAEEIEAAIKNTQIVIPVLLSGARFPTIERLSGRIARVARLQYLRFDYRNTRQDVEFISEWIDSLCPQVKRVRDRSV